MIVVAEERAFAFTLHENQTSSQHEEVVRSNAAQSMAADPRARDEPDNQGGL